MHNNIIDREIEVGRRFSPYANILGNKRSAFIFDNLRMLFTVSANALTLNKLNFDNVW